MNRTVAVTADKSVYASVFELDEYGTISDAGFTLKASEAKMHLISIAPPLKCLAGPGLQVLFERVVFSPRNISAWRAWFVSST